MDRDTGLVDMPTKRQVDKSTNLPVDMPPPKFATARDESRTTRGTRQALFSSVWLGRDLMPWQRYVLDVAGELDADGLPAYPLVVVTVQRQAGKTALVLGKSGERCLSVPGTRSWYTAQTGQDARAQWAEMVAQMETANAPLSSVTTVRRGGGTESLNFLNGSTFRPHPPIEKALHGKQADDVNIDEAWSFTDTEGRALIQATSPTKLTRPGAQTWVTSAGGTASSTWLAELVARGRGGDPGIAYFEWGIPDDLPLDDIEQIAAYHPAVGHTISLRSIRQLRADFPNDADFARAAGNRWTEVIGGAIPSDVHERSSWPDPIPDTAPVGYGAATSLDRTETAVVAAAELPDGTIVVEVIDLIPHAHSVHEKVASWCHDGPVAVDPVGPSATLWDNLKTSTRANIMPLSTGDVTAGCAGYTDGLAAGLIRVRPHPAMDAAVSVAVKRHVRDGAFLWARRAAGASVAVLEAATLAVWAVRHRPAATGEPLIYFPNQERQAS